MVEDLALLVDLQRLQRDGGRHRVDRILAHWQSSGEDQLAPDVWHVRSGGTDWELLSHPGHWQAGPLPEVGDGREAL